MKGRVYFRFPKEEPEAPRIKRWRVILISKVPIDGDHYIQERELCTVFGFTQKEAIQRALQLPDVQVYRDRTFEIVDVE